eukprot:3217213-Karenia_brevis.AAC.1
MMDELAVKKGLRLPTTNNGCEVEVRWSRQDAGAVPGSALQCVNFMLNQVEYYSRTTWDPSATREVDKALWKRAMDC